MAAEKRPRGRPPAETRASERVIVTFTPEQLAQLDAWAERKGQPRAVLIRDAALKAAKRG